MENVQDIEARHISDKNSNTRQDKELNQASKHEETTAYVIVNEEDLISMLLGYLERLFGLESFSHTAWCLNTRLKPLNEDLEYMAGQSEVGSDLETIEEATISVGNDALTWTTMIWDCAIQKGARQAIKYFIKMIPTVIDQDEATVMFGRDFTDMGQPCVVVALINSKAVVGVLDCCNTNLLCTVVDPYCSHGVGGDDVVIDYRENVDQDVVLLGCDLAIIADAQMNFAIKDDGLSFVDYVREYAREKCGYEYNSLDLLLVASHELRTNNILTATELEGLVSDKELRIAMGAGLESGAKIIAIFIDVVWEINQAPKTFVLLVP